MLVKSQVEIEFEFSEVDKYREALGTQVADFFQEVMDIDPERHKH